MPEKQKDPAYKRLTEIDVATGIAISLVVFGHLLFPESAHITWYVEVRALIYKFHMPFFMFLSGFIIHYSYQKKPPTSYQQYVLKKWRRFFPPYLIFAFLFMILENTFAEGSWDNILIDVCDIFFFPPKSPAGYLWYIYVLLIFYVLYPPAMKIAKGKPTKLILPAILIYFISAPALLSINQVFEYFLFVVLGASAAANYPLYLEGLKKWGWIGLLLFIILLFLSEKIPYAKLILGLASIPSLQYIASSKYLTSSRFLILLGQNTFYIYLMNTLVIGTLVVVIFRILAIPSQYFLYLIIPFTAAGLFLPIVINDWIIKKNRYLRMIFK